MRKRTSLIFFILLSALVLLSGMAKEVFAVEVGGNSLENVAGTEFQLLSGQSGFPLAPPAYYLKIIEGMGLRLSPTNVSGTTNASPHDVARLGIGKDPTAELDVFGTIAGNILQLFSGASGLGQIQFNGTNFQWRPGTTGTWNEFGGSITGGDCPAGQFAIGVNIDGSPDCAAPTVTSETDPVYSLSPASGISPADITKWNSALTSFTESDPTVSAWAKAAAKPTYNFSEILNNAGYMNYKPADTACATGEVLKYDAALNSGAGGWKCAAYSYADLASKPAADAFSSSQVTNLTANKLADGSTPWAGIVSSFWTTVTGAGITYSPASNQKVGINSDLSNTTNAALLQVGGSGYFANDLGVLGSGSFGGSLSAGGGARFPRQAGVNVTPGRGPSISLESPSNNVTTSKGTPDLCDVVGECSTDNTPSADLVAEYVCPVGSGGLNYNRDVFRDASNNSWHQTITCVAGTDSYSLSTNAGILEFANTSGGVKLSLGQNGNVSFFGSLIIPGGSTDYVLTKNSDGTASWQPSASGADQWGTQNVAVNTINGYLTGNGDETTLDIDTTKIQKRITAACVAGASIRIVAADGTVTCETDDTGATFASGGATAGFVKNNASGQLIGGSTIAAADLPMGVDTNASDDITTLIKGTGIDITGSGNSRTIAIDSAFLGSVRYQGAWNASSNFPSLAASPAADTKGYYYVVSAAGTRFSITWAIGDYIISNGSAWQKIDNTDVQAAITAATDGWDKNASDDLTGTGASGKIAKWSGGSALGDSVITENAEKIGIGASNKLATLTVKGKANFSASGKVENANASDVVNQYGGTLTKFLSEVGIGDYITIGTETKKVTAISSDSSLTADSNFTNSHSNATMIVYPAIARFDTSAGTEKITVNESGTLIADNVQVDSFIGAIEGWFSSKLQSANGLWVGSGAGTQVIAKEGGIWKWKGDTTGLAGPAGADGASGFTSLVRTTAEAAGANCAAGGLKIEAGLDDGAPSGTANDGTLEAGEVTQTGYICNGAQGANGTSGTNGTNGVDGTPGSVWFTGAADPSVTSPTGSIIGDFYLRTGATGGGDVYKKTAASTWTLQTNITGPLVAGTANQTLRYGSGATGDPAGWKATSGLSVDSLGNFSVSGTASLGIEKDISDFGAPLQSGFYQGFDSNTTDTTVAPIGDVPDTASVWSHLIAARHSNKDNNYQLQIASSYAVNSRLFFRKIAVGDTSSGNSAWNEIATRGANTFTGTQTITGNLYSYTDIATFESRFGRNNGEYLTIEGDDSNYSIVGKNDADENGNHNFALKNFAAGTGDQSISFWTQNNNVQAEAVRISGTGAVGIGTASPGAKLEVKGSVGTSVTAAATLSQLGGDKILSASGLGDAFKVEDAVKVMRNGITNIHITTIAAKDTNTITLTAEVPSAMRASGAYDSGAYSVYKDADLFAVKNGANITQTVVDKSGTLQATNLVGTVAVTAKSTGGGLFGFTAPSGVSSNIIWTLPANNDNGFLKNTGGAWSFEPVDITGSINTMRSTPALGGTRPSGNTYPTTAPYGLASLDANQKILVSELPEVVVGSTRYVSTWDASSNTSPVLPTPNPNPTTGNVGKYYVVSVEGLNKSYTNTPANTDWHVGDYVISNGVIWQKIDNTNLNKAIENSTTVAGHTTTLGTLGTTVAGHTTTLGTLGTTVAGHTTTLGTLGTTVAGHTTAIADKQDALPANANVENVVLTTASGAVAGAAPSWANPATWLKAITGFVDASDKGKVLGTDSATGDFTWLPPINEKWSEATNYATNKNITYNPAAGTGITGNVGIGTANPGAKIQVGSGATVVLAAGATTCPAGYERSIDAAPTGNPPGSGDTCVETGGTLVMTGRLTIRDVDPTIYLQDLTNTHRSAAIHTNSSIFYILRSDDGETSWQEKGGAWPMALNLDTNDASFGGSISTNAYSNNATGVSISGIKSRFEDPLIGTTKINITTGDDLLSLRGYGFDGNNNMEAARIQFDTEGTVAQLTDTTGRVPGVLRFFTADNPADTAAASTLRERMTINSSGAVGIGMAPFSSDKLSVRGAATLTGNLIVMNDVSPALPSGLHVDGTGDSYFMGNVGIGTDDPNNISGTLAKKVNVYGGVRVVDGGILMTSSLLPVSDGARAYTLRNEELISHSNTRCINKNDLPNDADSIAINVRVRGDDGKLISYPTTESVGDVCSDNYKVDTDGDGSVDSDRRNEWIVVSIGTQNANLIGGIRFQDLTRAQDTWELFNRNGEFLFQDAGGNNNLTLTQAGDLTIGNILNIKGNNIDLGYGITGREANAGKIGYQKFTADALDIVGAGTTAANRKIKFWNEGGATFTGNVGIGTASPDQKLSINGAVSTNRLVSFKQGDTAKAYVGLGMDNVMRVQTTDGTSVSLSTNNIDRLTVDGSTGSVVLNNSAQFTDSGISSSYHTYRSSDYSIKFNNDGKCSEESDWGKIRLNILRFGSDSDSRIASGGTSFEICMGAFDESVNNGRRTVTKWIAIYNPLNIPAGGPGATGCSSSWWSCNPANPE